MEGWAATHSLLSFASPMLRPQLITQVPHGNVASTLQTASATADPVTEDADIICVVLPGSNKQGCLVFICTADLRSELPMGMPRA